tara:strand:- start:82 stop:1074 length:993 start_codon:yes stop_codon:yes gene_type:complete
MIKIFLNSFIIFLLLIVNSHSGVTSASQSSFTISKIAKSLGHSSSNTANQKNNKITTSSIINTVNLKADIQADAAKFGLAVDSAAADILSGIANTDSKSISAALTSLTDNLTQLDDDYVSTPDQNTIVYSMAWSDLEKVTSYDGKTYSSNNNVFSASGTQQTRGKIYVNFKKKEIWADIDVKLTRAEGATSTLQTNYNSGTAGFTSVPIVATTNNNFKADGTNGHVNFDGINDTMKKNATTIQDVCNGCTGLTKAELIDNFNHKVTGGNTGDQDIFFYGKFTTATSSTSGLGTIAVEGGYVDDGANESTFAGSIERLEASGELTGKAFEE